jgi:hypothetical protein
VQDAAKQAADKTGSALKDAADNIKVRLQLQLTEYFAEVAEVGFVLLDLFDPSKFPTYIHVVHIP